MDKFRRNCIDYSNTVILCAKTLFEFETSNFWIWNIVNCFFCSIIDWNVAQNWSFILSPILFKSCIKIVIIQKLATNFSCAHKSKTSMAESPMNRNKCVDYNVHGCVYVCAWIGNRCVKNVHKHDDFNLFE